MPSTRWGPAPKDGSRRSGLFPNVVKDLESRGYVRFTAGRDRKEKLVAFTPAGREYAGGCLRDLYQAEERAMEQVDPALCRAMVDGMRAYTEAFTREVRHGAQS